MSHPRLIALLLALVTLVVYLPVVQCDFINFDDPIYVTENRHVQDGLTWPGVKWAFTTLHGANWHPLTWLSHMADDTLFGLNPAAHHFINVLFHSINTALLFIVLLRLTGAVWPCAWVAAMFAWHPLHVESVAWISERKDVLSTFFALLSLLCYTTYAKENRRRGFWLALLYFCFSLMAKPMFVTLPCLLLLLDWWPLERIRPTRSDGRVWRQRLWEKVPFFLPAIASCIVTFLAQRNGAAVLTLAQLSFGARLQIALIAYGRYLWNTFWPMNLAVLYPLPNHPHESYALAATLVLVLLSWVAWRTRQVRGYFAVGWLWFLGTLVPVIGLVKVGSMALADRYTYFPLIGVFIVMAFGARDLVARFQPIERLIRAVALLVLPVCIVLTENQIRYWHNSETLFSHAIAVTGDNANACINLGSALEVSGQLQAALAEYRKAARLADDSVDAHFDIANVLVKLGRTTEALPEFYRAIALDPTTSNLHNGLGMALADLGKFSEATNQFAVAAQLDPENPWPHVETARVWLKLGRDPEAVADLRTALQIDPDNFQILTLAAHVLAADKNSAVRDGAAALTLASEANALTGGVQPLVLDVLGMAYAETGRFDDACAAAQKALDIARTAQMKNLEAMEERLKLYTSHQPWRESFLATNGPAGN